MENIKDYRQFLFEKQGLSPAIYKSLKDYFEKSDKPTMTGAQEFLSKTNKGWKLSQEDFSEAKEQFKK
jgi:hypothetical protein